jgi:hypothetical protein
MSEEIVKIIERTLKVGENHAMCIAASGFLSTHPSPEDLAKDIIGALEKAGYNISRNVQPDPEPVETSNLT